MFIKEIVIEGFKSYAARTVINFLDPQFNAITGLNGSGKSNILDSILFLLGLSQLSMVLIFAELGHAGVSKASVTIEFDNSDPSQSPQGFETQKSFIVTRQISNGKSKYFLNGHNESNNRIKTLFKSVQLNIDNPHFLVAQGRITKIINLKPAELLLMLEETAGTSFYIEKKHESQRIIQKKEEKMSQINFLIENEISPQIEKLKNDQAQFLQYKNLEINLEKISKMIKAFEFYSKDKAISEKTKEKDELKVSVEELKGKVEKAKSKWKKYEDEYNQTLLKKTMEDQSSELDDAFTKIKGELAKSEAMLNAAKSSTTSKEADLSTLKRTQRKAEDDIQVIDNQTFERGKRISSMNEEIKGAKSLLEEIKINLKAIENGEFSSGKDALIHQEKKLQQAINSCQSEYKFLDEKIGEGRSKLEQIKNIQKNQVCDSKALEVEIVSMEKEISMIEDSLSEMSSIENQLSRLNSSKTSLRSEITRIEQQLNVARQGGDPNRFELIVFIIPYLSSLLQIHPLIGT